MLIWSFSWIPAQYKLLNYSYRYYPYYYYHYNYFCVGEISEECCRKLQLLQNCVAQIILRKKTSNDTFRVLNGLNLASIRKMHKCILILEYLNNVVPKYLTQYFTRNVDLHDHATRRRNDLHPPKPKRIEGLFVSNSLSNCVSATSVNSFKNMLIKYFTL